MYVAIIDRGNYKWGMFNSTGEQLLPPLYGNSSYSNRRDRPKPFGNSNDLFLVKLGNDYGIVKKGGKDFQRRNYGYIDSFKNGLVRTSFKSNKGIALKNGKEVIPPKYKKINEFTKDGFAIVENHSYKKGVINTNGNEIIPLMYNKIKISDNENIIQVGLDDKIGLFDKQGNKIIKPTYDYTYNDSRMLDFAYGLAAVIKDEMYGVIDKKGNVILPLKNDFAYIKNSNLIIFQRNDKWQLFNVKQRRRIKTNYASEMNFGNNIVVEKAGKWGVLDSKGNVIVPLMYDDADTFYSNHLKNIILLKLNGVYGVFNSKGEKLIPPKFNSIKQSNHDKDVTYIITKKDGKYGVLDSSGKEIIPPKYKFIYNFDKNVAIVHDKNYRYGLLNVTTDKFVIPFKYDRIWEVENHPYYIIKVNGKHGLVDENAKVIIPLKYDEMFLDYGILVAKINGEQGKYFYSFED